VAVAVAVAVAVVEEVKEQEFILKTKMRQKRKTRL
jgi:hypothetical protein